MPYEHCPYCTGPMSENEEGNRQCSNLACNFIFYDNPIPCVATIVPTIVESWSVLNQPLSGKVGIFGPDFWKERPFTSPVGEGCQTGILIVQRGVQPFKGKWCLPCGYMNKHDHPKEAAVREVLEETGVEVRLEKLLCVCNPMPGEINQMTIHYLGRPIGGELEKEGGDDAAAAMYATKEKIEELGGLCFRSHRMVAEKWFEGATGPITGQDCQV